MLLVEARAKRQVRKRFCARMSQQRAAEHGAQIIGRRRNRSSSKPPPHFGGEIDVAKKPTSKGDRGRTGLGAPALRQVGEHLRESHEEPRGQSGSQTLDGGANVFVIVKRATARCLGRPNHALERTPVTREGLIRPQRQHAPEIRQLFCGQSLRACAQLGEGVLARKPERPCERSGGCDDLFHTGKAPKAVGPAFVTTGTSPDAALRIGNNQRGPWRRRRAHEPKNAFDGRHDLSRRRIEPSRQHGRGACTLARCLRRRW